MKPKKKVTNERASEYDIYIVFPFSKMSQSMGMPWSAGN
jgi:hypothetical protein